MCACAPTTLPGPLAQPSEGWSFLEIMPVNVGFRHGAVAGAFQGGRPILGTLRALIDGETHTLSGTALAAPGTDVAVFATALALQNPIRAQHALR